MNLLSGSLDGVELGVGAVGALLDDRGHRGELVLKHLLDLVIALRCGDRRAVLLFVCDSFPPTRASLSNWK